MTDATELEDLEDLLADEGWRRVLTRYQQEWGPAGSRYLQAVNDAINRVEDAEQRRGLERVRFAQKVMAEFMAWPAERARTLRAQKDRPKDRAEEMRMLERQDREMAGVPRRGGL